MQIKIEGIHDDRLHRPLQNIANLFYEECELMYGGEEPADFVISLDCLQTDEHVTVSGEVKGTVIKERHTKSFSPGMNEKEAFKQVKNTISYVYLNLLQAHTGITQKWGILTGIRPTKLLHKKLQSGMPKAQAHTELKKDYLIHDEKIELMQEIVDRQLAAVPDLYQVKDEVSIYIGIPFCPTKCAYCTFLRTPFKGRRAELAHSYGGCITKCRKSANG